MRDYQIDPNDSGFFVEDWKLRDEFHITFDMSTENGIMQLDNPKDYPDYKYFVRVGGGWRGFKKKVNAKRYYKQD
jgi:hypothetical protein